LIERAFFKAILLPYIPPIIFEKIDHEAGGLSSWRGSIYPPGILNIKL